MKKPLQHYLLLLLLGLFPLGALATTAPVGLLDGMAFVGLNGEAGKSLDPDEHEEITFHNGLFTSVSCEPYHFESAEYSAKVVDDAIHFTAVTESPTHGTISWQGVVKGDTAEVSFVWTKERWYWNTRREYWFRGTRRNRHVTEPCPDGI
ncbi:hypothetical protein HNR62_001894 [Oceanisphaera litoralis]|uniref:hypothetical protein n=1 Tax=Oceanisphaera litoralis TaxID=225144 RepID=UPI001956B8EC|nr:hypothetical protein [Oceanisphaera litoralis]MBM7456014.1 hypothetical protein [Oceanisphaera litoralis]